VREVIEDAFTGSMWVPALGKSIVGPSFEPSAKTPWGTRVSRRAPRLSNERRAEVRTEELLLALIAHGEGVAAHVLSEFGVDLARAAVATTHVRCPPLPGPSASAESGQWPPAPGSRN
jgi:hypothetical protein